MTVRAGATLPAEAVVEVETRRLSRRVYPALIFGASVVAMLIIAAAFAPLLAPFDPDSTKPEAINLPPGHDGHILGTDDLGRDELSRLLYGARTSLSIGLLSTFLALALGGIAGLVSAYAGGFVDMALGRGMDILLSLPLLVVAMAIVATLGSGFIEVAIALAVGLTPVFFRMIRGPVMAELEKDYVLAARLLGAGPVRIVRVHILPQIGYVVAVQTTLAIAAVILVESTLAYLGLGPPPPTASWGAMLSAAQPLMLDAPWPAILPGMAITLAVLSFNLLGDGLREVLDPSLRRSAKL